MASPIVPTYDFVRYSTHHVVGSGRPRCPVQKVWYVTKAPLVKRPRPHVASVFLVRAHDVGPVQQDMVVKRDLNDSISRKK